VETEMMRCLVLGGNGFIGSHLVEGLINHGYDVKVFDCFTNGISNLKTSLKGLEIIKGDFLRDEEIGAALKNVDLVFHYISTTIPVTAKNDPIYDIETNVVGTVKLLQRALNSNVKKIIFSSSGGTVYGEPENLPVNEKNLNNPIDPYGISKFTIEKYLYYFHHAYGLDYKILRYSNPYGERQNPDGRQGIVPIFLNKIKRGECPTVYGDGTMVRDYIYVKDAVEATLSVIKSDTTEKIFNVGSGEGKSINEIIQVISKVTGKKIEVKYAKGYMNYVSRIILDVSKIQSLTGWRPATTLEEGVRRTWQWINASY
jgi:UDP-glucose 4-epimerase